MKASVNIYFVKPVMRGEWENVCMEAHELMRAFFLDGFITVPSNMIDMPRMLRCVERRTVGKSEPVWYASAYEYRKGDAVVPGTGDAVFAGLPFYPDYSHEDPLCRSTCGLFRTKTQAIGWQFYALAVACLFEDRLGENVFMATDMSLGQCRRAVELVNKHLAVPIRLPSICNMERLFERTSVLLPEEQEKVTLFVCSFIGNKNAEFGTFLREHYSQKVLKGYWEKRFQSHPVGTAGFDGCVKEYLAWGFSVKGLLRYAVFKEECSHQYEELVRYLMGTGIYLTRKNLVEVVGLKLLWPDRVFKHNARFESGGNQNKTIDRYVPLGELYDELLLRFPGMFDIRRTMRECFNEGFLE